METNANGSEMAAEQKRKPGPVPGAPTVKFTIQVGLEDAEWAKRQPGGASQLIRNLLSQARAAQSQDGKK